MVVAELKVWRLVGVVWSLYVDYVRFGCCAC